MVMARSRALGAFYGLAIGDALGMPTQFLSRRKVASLFGVLEDFESGPDENEISRGMVAGTVTDDTDQAVIIARELIAGNGRVDQGRLAKELKSWEKRMTDAGSLDLLGPSTRRAIDLFERGTDLDVTGRWGDTNGAAMRIAPVGIAAPVEPTRRFCELVFDASRLTHNTSLAIAGSAAVAAVVSAGIDGAATPAALKIGTEMAAAGAEFGHFVAGADVSKRILWALTLTEGLEDKDVLDAIYDLVGTGLATQEAVPAAFAIASASPADPWRACILAAGLGGDSDTVAAMAGAMVGACTGIDAFPRSAVDLVNERNNLGLDALVDSLLSLRGRLGGGDHG
jgi:ADP-ribosylglycohydrolase